MLSVCNDAWREFCDNLLTSAVTQFKVRGVLVVALDAPLAAHLRRRWPSESGVRVLELTDEQSHGHDKGGSGELRWRSDEYYRAVNLKPRLARAVLRSGRNVLLSDRYAIK